MYFELWLTFCSTYVGEEPGYEANLTLIVAGMQFMVLYLGKIPIISIYGIIFLGRNFL